MAPYTVEVNGQVITSLLDNENNPISKKNLFVYDNNDKIVNIKNSKFYLPNFDIDLIQGGLSRSTYYFEQDFLEKLDNYLKEDSIIIDIGANIGNHTLYWANERRAKKIYAFEPIPHTFGILKKNIEINQLEDRVILNNVGLSDQKGMGEVKTFCKQNLGGTRLKKLQSDTPYTIPLRTLDSFNIKEDTIDLIKIDVEGMDNEVLLGASKTIRKYKPIIMIESFPDSFEKSDALLKDFGYTKEQDFGSFEYLYINKTADRK